MGLFSRKKRREPAPTFVGPTHASATPSFSSQPADAAGSFDSESASGGSGRPAALASKAGPPAASSRFQLPFKSGSSSATATTRTEPTRRPSGESTTRASSFWERRPSQDVARQSSDWARPDRAQVFSGVGDPARGSTLSLRPSRASVDGGQRQRHASAGAPGGTGMDDQTKWSRWRIGGRPTRARQSSSGSMLHGDGGFVEDDGSSFVVKSFRSVSRVHEDPVPPPPPVPPVPAAPLDLPVPNPTSIPPPAPQPARASTDLQRYESRESHHQQESLRTSVDLGTASAPARQPRRPSLATLGNGRPSSQACDRDGPGTIPAEAFRAASARSRSAVSLASMDSPPLEASRPRFEPQRPQSRASRRGSSYSEAGSSVLVPPRPSFAIGQHSNGSGSSIDSRSSSTSNVIATSPATTTSAIPYDPQISPSSPVSRSRLSLSSTSREGESATVERPRLAKRMSSGDSEIRLIAAYGDMLTASPPLSASSPSQERTLPLVEEPESVYEPARSALSSEDPPRPRIVTNPSASAPSPERAPSFAIQPPTPQAQTELPFNRPRRTSSLQPDSVAQALEAMGLRQPAARSRPNVGGKGKASAVGGAGAGWTSDTSDDDMERLSTSDDEFEDEVPLATIRSRSQTDLASMAGGLRSKTSFETTRSARPTSHQEVPAPASRAPPAASQQQRRMSQASLGAAPALQRRGSDRRSMSTLSFSTSMTASQAASRPNLAPAGTPAQSQRPPYQALRSVSNPSTATMPSLASTSTVGSSTLPSALPSPLLKSNSRDRSSASSGSATTASSFPHTPKDRSPETSVLGIDTQSLFPPSQASASGPKPAVKFNLATARSTIGEPRSGRLSMLGAASVSTPNLLPASSASELAPPVPSVRANPSYLQHSGQAAARETSSVASAREPAPAAATGTVNDRLKARHRAEALRAMQIGRDLNDPSGVVPDSEAQEALLGGDGSDENEPLANLPSRGSMLGGMSGMGGYGPMGGLPGMGMGGQYSQLAVPPPGVDPYLYASLPPDQKMSLHQRSQQMMAMMQEAAMRAKAESVMGGGGGSMIGGHGGGGGSIRSGRPASTMSLGAFESYNGAAGAPYGYMSPQQQHMMMPQHHQLPAFAPPFAMSQPFFHPQYAPQGSMYGMPQYAGSAIGFSGMPASARAAPSAIGLPSRASGLGVPGRRPGGHGRAASAIGTGYRA